MEKRRKPVQLLERLPLRVDDVAPIEVPALKRVDQRLRRSNVGGHRDVVHIAQTQQASLVRLVRTRADGIALQAMRAAIC